MPFVFGTSYFKPKINRCGWGVILSGVTSWALVTEDTDEPGEDASFCVIWPDLPMLSDCSPSTPLASGSRRMSPMMTIRPLRSMRRQRLFGHDQEAARDDEVKQPFCSACAFIEG